LRNWQQLNVRAFPVSFGCVAPLPIRPIERYHFGNSSRRGVRMTDSSEHASEPWFFRAPSSLWNDFGGRATGVAEAPSSRRLGTAHDFQTFPRCDSLFAGVSV
jgi:hypothetical protein